MKERKELWPGGLLYAGDSIGADSLALAGFALSVKAERAVDLGCGSGILLLLLARERPELSVTGVELRSSAAEECGENILANGLEARCRVVTGDFRQAELPRGKAELVIANPPYFPADSGGVSPDPDRAAMRTESASLSELCACAAGLLRPGGAFCLVHRCERMGAVFAAGAAAGLEPKRMRLTASAPGQAPSVFLLEFRRGARPGLVVEPTLYQHDHSGAESREYRALCHMEE